MRAVICSSFSGIEALELGELADRVPGPGQVVVDVHAAALSFMDTLMVAGRYQMKPALPSVPGSDAAGVVLAVGDGLQRLTRRHATARIVLRVKQSPDALSLGRQLGLA